jgi:hypothetical protein
MKCRTLLLTALLFALFTSVPATTASAAQQKHSHVITPWYEPLLRGDRSDWPTWTCIIWHESRSTWAVPNLKDDNPSATNIGIFQFTDDTFRAHISVDVHVWQATPRQQAIAALNTRRVDRKDGYNGFGPWKGDGCV